MSGKRIPAAIRSRDKKSVYAIHDIIVLFLDVVMELLTGHRPMQVRAIFNQIIVDHISVIRILTAHLLVHLTLTMLIGALKDRGGIDGGCEWCVIGSGNEAGTSG